jgi:hypothetical protein
MMPPEVLVLYGIPTMFLLIGLVVYGVVRLESWRYDRLAARATVKRSGPA